MSHLVDVFDGRAHAMSHVDTYRAVTAPLLEAVDADSIIVFLKLYERYKRVVPKGEQTLSLLECVDTELLEVLRAAHPVECKSDVSFNEYLSSLTLFSDPQDAVRELSHVTLGENDVQAGGAVNSVVQYNIKFDRILRRLPNQKIQDQYLIKYYVEGIKIPYLHSRLQSLRLVDGLTLKTVKEKTEALMVEFVTSQSVAALSIDDSSSSSSVCPLSSTSSLPSVTPSQSKSVVVQSPSNPPSSQSSSSGGYDLRPRICKACGAPWTHEHWLTCSKRGDAAVKKVNAIGSNSSPGFKPPAYRCQVGTKSFNAYVDTGSDCSCISRKLWNTLSRFTNIYSKPTPVKLKMPDGRLIPTKEISCELQCDYFGDSPEKLHLYELPDDSEDTLLLGNDATKYNSPVKPPVSQW